MTFTLTQTPVSQDLVLYPDGTPHHSECTASPNVTHNLNIDDPYDISDDDTSYVWMQDTSTVTDMYTIQNHTTETGTINYVKIYARAKTHLYTISPTGYYRMLAYHSGTTSRQLCTLTTGYNNFSYLLTTTPSGGAWNWNAVDALQIGWDANSPSYYLGTIYKTLRPNGNGTYAEWTGMFGPPSRNFENVDEEVADDLTTYDCTFYYSHHPTTYRNTYTFEDFTTTNPPTAVNLYFDIAGDKIVHYDEHAAPYLWLSAASITEGTYITPLGYSWRLFSERFTTAPGGDAWTWAFVNALEAGLKTYTHTDGYIMRLTQLYLIVEYPATVYPEIRTTQMYAIVNYTPSSGVCTLNEPTSYTYSNNRQVNKFNTWAGERKVYDVARTSKTLTLTGIEYDTDTVDAEDRLECVRIMKDNGAYVTISGIGDTLVDTDWMITDFTYNKNIDNTNIYDWTLTLERYENAT